MSKQQKDMEKGTELLDYNEKKDINIEVPKKKDGMPGASKFLVAMLIISIIIVGIFFLYPLFSCCQSKTNAIKIKNIELRKVKNYEELSIMGAEILSDEMKKNPSATFGLATGSTPIGLYKKLIEKYNNKEITFKNIKTYNLDEYCGLPRNHSQTYYTYMMENLFNHVDINKNNVHIPNSEGGNYELSSKNYNNELDKAQIDIQILGIGANGHIGFNEPGTSFESTVHVANLNQQTIKDNSRFFDNDISKVPTKAITMGIKNILGAKTIVLLASGKNKAEAIKSLIQGEPNVKVPASALQLHKGKVIVIADEDACSLLEI